MFFVFSLNIGKTSALVNVCVIICAADMLLIEESWFILILPWCVYRGSLNNEWSLNNR